MTMDKPVTASAGGAHGAVSVPTVKRSVGVVVVTQGTRPVELAQALESVQAQRGVEVDCVVVGNGWDPTDVPEPIRTIALPEHGGIPAGRNVGIREVRGDLVFLLDDDAKLPAPDTLQRLARLFAEQASLGIVQIRIVDPVGDITPRRYVPRLRAGDPLHSSDVTTFCEGATAIRREVSTRRDCSRIASGTHTREPIWPGARSMPATASTTSATSWPITPRPSRHAATASSTSSARVTGCGWPAGISR